jgi:hypothetical protein
MSLSPLTLSADELPDQSLAVILQSAKSESRPVSVSSGTRITAAGLAMIDGASLRPAQHQSKSISQHPPLEKGPQPLFCRNLWKRPSFPNPHYRLMGLTNGTYLSRTMC